MWWKLLCRLFGHRVNSLDVNSRTACCSRCNATLLVSYDMAYGGTVVEGILREDS